MRIELCEGTSEGQERVEVAFRGAEQAPAARDAGDAHGLPKR